MAGSGRAAPRLRVYEPIKTAAFRTLARSAAETTSYEVLEA
jgi:hypothetical protein